MSRELLQDWALDLKIMKKIRYLKKKWTEDIEFMNYVPELKKYYKDSVIKELVKEFEYKSIMQVPKLEKIVISVGVGEAVRIRSY